MNSHTKLSAFLIFIALILQRSASKFSDEEFLHAERNDLISLRDSLISAANLHSNWTGPPCHDNRSRWHGIACYDSHVIGIDLVGIQLTGTLSSAALQNVTYLASLNLSNNALHGNLPALKGLVGLQIVSLSQNRFSGSIPVEFVALPNLSLLELQDNLLNGTIPPFDQQSLMSFNVSYNFLGGRIPDTTALRRFSARSYDHNLGLCGKPLDRVCPGKPPPPPPPSPKAPSISPSGSSGAKGFEVWALVLVAVGAAAVPFVIILCFLCYNRRHQKAPTRGVENSGDVSSEFAAKKTRSAAGSGEEALELEFFNKERPTFGLDDLLRSSAEVMGKGRLGTTYRATLESGPVVVVKRLRDMGGVGRKEFVQQLQVIGRIRHENLVEIIGFYYSKNEKLVIYEDVPNGSLFQLLHDSRGAGRVPLKWASRLTIAKGIARGLTHLHQSFPPHKVPHANLNSSNILILHNHHRHHHPKLTDFGFLPLLPSPHHQQKLAIAKTPEFSQHKKLTHKADVYCFGLILLEIITGHVPDDDAEGLPEWVRSVVSNEWSTDLLDLEIVAEKMAHGEMFKLTEIALECTAMEPERRPNMIGLITRIEEIKGLE